MSNLTHRKVNTGEDSFKEQEKAAAAAAATVSEEEMEPLPSCPSGESIAQDNSGELMKDTLKDLHPRWRNWVIRGVFTTLMLGGFVFILFLGINISMKQMSKYNSN